MFFDEIVHGVQYYRSPTPLPEEWETDIPNFEKYNLDAFQIRINWRWNERREDEYDFSDVDRLLELAEKNGRKVIMKFLLECAPQYIFEKYSGTRIGSKGELIRPGSHGAFYGGWLPCFTNPYVRERAVKFVEKVAERYSTNKNIIIWNAWNEIRNRPVDECFCPHCRKAFGEYLKEKYTTVENLNKFYGVAEESFETVNLPVMAHGFWDIYEFKKFKGSYELKNYLKFVYDAIRKYDKTTPIMAHVGACSAFQTTIGDICDDYNVSGAVDFYGTSLPFDTRMFSHENRMNMMTLCDFMRSVDENYFIHEIYPSLGMFKVYDTPFDMKYKLYCGLSCGAKGLVYWQYRAERLGMENDCSGIMHMDGTPRDVAEEIKKFGADLKKDMCYFKDASPVSQDAAIVFDFNSQLMAEIEENCVECFDLKLYTGLFYYHNEHKGMYNLLRNTDYNVGYVETSNPELFKNYKMLLFPYYTMLDQKILPYIEKFVSDGGTVIFGEGFGMRQENTWMNPYSIKAECLMNAKMLHRVEVSDDFVTLFGKKTQIYPYKTQYCAQNAEVVARFDDGTAAAFEIKHGKGKIYLLGFALGYSYLKTGDKVWQEFIDKIARNAGLEKCVFGDFENGIYERRMVCKDKEIVFIFNNSESVKNFDLGKKIVSYGADACINDSVMTLKPGEIGYAVTE